MENGNLRLKTGGEELFFQVVTISRAKRPLQMSPARRYGRAIPGVCNQLFGFRPNEFLSAATRLVRFKG
jgi:hypothetical protein